MERGPILCYSTLGLPEWPIEDLCQLLRQFGYSGIEIALTPAHIERRGDEPYWTAARTAAERAELEITCLHLGNPRLYGDPQAPRLLHRDPARRGAQVGLAAAAFEIASRVGCPMIAAASGAMEPAMSEPEAWDMLLASIEMMLASLPAGCQFLIEHEPEHFIRTTDQILELFRRTGGKVGCNLDVGHLEVAGEPIGGSIERLGGVIRNVHLEDIRGRRHQHLMPGEGEIDFDRARSALAKIGYKGPLTADLYPYANAPIQALIRAREAFASWTN
jgi:protein FrlC